MRSTTTRAGLERELKAAGTPQRAARSARYFKTGKGEYGEGDLFLGLTVPALRAITRRYRSLDLDELERLLESKVHEHRLAALEILVARYQRGDALLREAIVVFYLRNTRYVNNWDLVDASAGYILGEHLKRRPRRILAKLARSQNLWERRIAVVSTIALVRAGELADALRIAALLLEDKHDLIHKAVGWLLREAGDQDRSALLRFLEKHYASLPRTSLRYAIEHFGPQERSKLLRGEFRGLNRAG